MTQAFKGAKVIAMTKKKELKKIIKAIRKDCEKTEEWTHPDSNLYDRGLFDQASAILSIIYVRGV